MEKHFIKLLSLYKYLIFLSFNISFVRWSFERGFDVGFYTRKPTLSVVYQNMCFFIFVFLSVLIQDIYLNLRSESKNTEALTVEKDKQ